MSYESLTNMITAGIGRESRPSQTKSIRLLTKQGAVIVLSKITLVDCDEHYLRFYGIGFQFRIQTSEMVPGTILISTDGGAR